MKKLLLQVFVILIVVLLIWRIYRLIIPGTDSGQKEAAKPPVAVEVDSLQYGPISETRQLTGTVYPYYQYIIAPKVSGRIIEITKRIGDWIDQGEVVARIDDAEYQQAVREAEANLKIAQATLIEAKSQLKLAGQELERVQSLKAEGMVASAELEAATTNYQAQESRLKLSQAQVEQRKAALTSARIRLGYTVLTASQSGFIGERFVDEGTLLSPNSPVLLVIGIYIVFIRTTVIERDYGRIRPGQTALIHVDAYPDKRFTGTVLRIAPKLEEASRVAEMEVEVLNDSLILKPGMFAKLTIILQEKENAQIVPSRAIVMRNGQAAVFMIKDGENIARYVPVELGIISAEKTEIISPKLDGLVVTLGQHLLEDRSPIILPIDFSTNNS
jgi:RND family efflux transporter MFP subunit